jgi:hypothetical protein
MFVVPAMVGMAFEEAVLFFDTKTAWSCENPHMTLCGCPTSSAGCDGMYISMPLANKEALGMTLFLTECYILSIRVFHSYKKAEIVSSYPRGFLQNVLERESA